MTPLKMAEPLLDRLSSRDSPKNLSVKRTTSAISAMRSAYSTNDAPQSASRGGATASAGGVSCRLRTRRG